MREILRNGRCDHARTHACVCTNVFQYVHSSVCRPRFLYVRGLARRAVVQLEVAAFLESVYGMDVERVNTINYLGKRRLTTTRRQVAMLPGMHVCMHARVWHARCMWHARMQAVLGCRLLCAVRVSSIVACRPRGGGCLHLHVDDCMQWPEARLCRVL